MSTPVIVVNLADDSIQFETRSPGNDNDPDFHSENIGPGSALNLNIDSSHDRIAVSNGGDVRKQIDISAHLGRPLVVVATGSVGSALFLTVVQVVLPTVAPALSEVAVAV